MKRKNIFKSLLAAAMALTMIFGAAPLSGFVGISLPLFSMKAEAATITGTTEDGLFEYEVDIRPGRYTATITRCNKDASGEITIPETIGECEVKQIGNRAFSDCTGITSIVIPDGVTYIGARTFYGCTSLEEITVSPDNKTYSSVDGVLFNKDKSELIVYPEGNGRSAYTVPDSVTNIGVFAFSGCTTLSKVDLPKTLTTIEAGTFRDCTSLKEIVIPDSVTEIRCNWDLGAFSGCTSLSKVKLSNNLTIIGDRTFSGCTSLAEIDIPDSVTSIGRFAFSGCTSLSKVDLPKKLTTIEAGTFRDCTSLKEIVIPDSVTAIGSSAFSNCISLESITIGSGVESLGDEWIASCRRLANITVSPDNKTYSSVDGVLFNNCLLYTSPSPRDLSTSRMPSSA